MSLSIAWTFSLLYQVKKVNIFFTDTSPSKAAQSLPDKHIVKMPLETVQMLVSALQRYNVDYDVRTKSGSIHKGGYPNHPCTRWAGDTSQNYLWLALHGLALCAEYQERYHREHACKEQIHKALEYLSSIPEGPLSDPAQAMPDELKDKDPVVAYRNYIQYKVDQKPDSFKWDKAKHIPDWIHF